MHSNSEQGLRAFKNSTVFERWIAGGILAVVVIAMGLLLPQLNRLRTHYSVDQFLPKNHPLLQADFEVRNRFFLEKSQPALVTLKLRDQSDWFKTSHLEKLERLTVEIREMEGIKGALSLATVQGASTSSEELSVGSLLRFPSEKERRERVINDPMLSPLLVSHDGRTTIVLVNLVESMNTDRLVEVMNSVESKLRQTFPEADVDVGGVPAIQGRLTYLVKGEIIRFMGLALVASSVVLFVVFSSPISVFVPLLAIFIVNFFVLCFMAMAGFPMTVLASTVPILAAVWVLSLCIHTMLRLVEESHRDPEEIPPGVTWLSERGNLVLRTLKPLFLPNLLTALTVCFGFGTLMTTTVPLIREFGIVVAASTLISWAVTMLLLIPLFLLMPLPRVRTFMLSETQWVGPIFRQARLMVIGTVVIGASLALFGQRLHWTAKLFDDLPKNESARVATERMDRELGGVIPLEIVIEIEPERMAEADPWNDPQALASLDILLKEWRQRPEVGSAFGLPELLRQTSGGELQAGQVSRLPASRSAIAESWFLLTMSEENPLKNYLTSDGRATRLSVHVRDVPSQRALELREELLLEARQRFPAARVTAAGMASTVHPLNNELSRALIHGFWEALAVISILLLIIFRSVRWTFVAILPNLVPAASLLGVLAIVQTPIKPGVALVFSIALGIAFNNTVYLLQRLRNLMRETGCGPDEEVIRMLRLEGNPCLVATLCVFAGFSIFLFSQFDINRTFGIYMLISLFFGLVGDLVFLPALIRWWPELLAPRREMAIRMPEAVPGLPDVLETSESHHLAGFETSLPRRTS